MNPIDNALAAVRSAAAAYEMRKQDGAPLPALREAAADLARAQMHAADVGARPGDIATASESFDGAVL